MRLESLTFLRFIAALFVVIWHYGRNSDLVRVIGASITSGPQMVTFFYVLSGFVLMIAHFNKTDDSLGKYYWSRIARITPVYFFALILACFVSPGNTITSIFLSATFLQSWFPPYPLSINYPGWSLSVEAFFYLTFPAMLYLIKNSAVKPINALITSCIIWAFTQAVLINLLNSPFYAGDSTASHDLIFYSPLSHLCSFIIGVAGGLYYIKKNTHFNDAIRSIWFIVFILSVCAIFALLQYPNFDIDMFLPTGSSLYAPVFLLFIFSLSVSKNIFTKALSNKYLVVLGNSSYALYILQYPIHRLYEIFLANYFYMSESNHFYLYVLLLTLISILSYYLIEKPGGRLIVRLSKVI